MSTTSYKSRAKVWLYQGNAPWHFVTVPKEQSDAIRKRFKAQERGWRSLPVSVTTGKTTWKTSMFYDTRAGAYLLPLKAQVRAAERIKSGAMIALSFTVHP